MLVDPTRREGFVSSGHMQNEQILLGSGEKLETEASTQQQQVRISKAVGNAYNKTQEVGAGRDNLPRYEISLFDLANKKEGKYMMCGAI